MSDNENKNSSAWTDEAKYNFLLRIVAQLKEEGKQINWLKFDMPGRTTKSLQNQWTKINKQISEVLEEGKNGEAGGAASTPARKVATPRKPRAKKVVSKEKVQSDAEDDEGGAAATPKETPRKRRGPAATPKRTPKARKAVEDDDVTTTPVKGEDDVESE
ncbi:hypothetical protein B0T10DRAFT_218962 [Thelonectria olida]|uniref:Myb-like domain-containing protein n=1 Tax=Thelonectria olida TaxID=1576542 RepID=A0A9P9AT59_9HYPO|nr:hypothetical protein B0T10DRAFT_218962 [Thelonectria olida]